MTTYRYRDLGVATVDRSGRPIEVLAGVTAGPVGPQGPTGPRGLRGLQGIRGVQGIQGPLGPQGVSKWTVLDPVDGDLPTQLAAAHGGAGMALGDRYWLLPGTWDVSGGVGGDLVLDVADVTVAGSRRAVIELDAGEKIDITADHVFLLGVAVENVNGAGLETESILLQGDYDLVEDIELRTDVTAAGTRHYGIRLASTAEQCAVRACYLHPDVASGWPGGVIVFLEGACAAPSWVLENHIELSPTTAMAGATYAIAAGVVDSHVGTVVAHNLIELASADYLCGVSPANRWYIGANEISGNPGQAGSYCVNFVIANVEHVRIEANEFTVPIAGVELKTPGLQHISIVGNHFYGADDAATRGVELSTQGVTDLTIGNNAFESLGAGVRMTPSASSSRIAISSNTFFDMAESAIHIAVGATISRGISITGNPIGDCVSAGIYLQGAGMRNVSVVGNTIYDAAYAIRIVGLSNAYATIGQNSVYEAKIVIESSNYFAVTGNVCYYAGICIDIDGCTYFSTGNNTCNDVLGGDGITVDNASDHFTGIGNVSPDGFSWGTGANKIVVTPAAGQPLNQT